MTSRTTRSGPRSVYYTAATLDGFLADEHDSLDWLFVQEHDDAGPMGHSAFMAGVGAVVMGATTYAWILEHEAGAWPYEQPCFVFTHRDLPEAGPGVRLVQGPPADHWSDIAATAGEGDVWVVGGGDLAGQLAEAGLLDEVMVSIAPVTLGTGRPLLPRRWNLRLTRLERNGAFVCAWYDVLGPGEWPGRSG